MGCVIPVPIGELFMGYGVIGYCVLRGVCRGGAYASHRICSCVLRVYPGLRGCLCLGKDLIGLVGIWIRMLEL